MTESSVSSRPVSPRPRAVALLAVVGFAVVGAAVIVLAQAGGPTPPPLAAPIEPRYPDLGMAPLSDLIIGENEEERTYLRFSATLVNQGAGDLLLAAHRSLPITTDWHVVQRVPDAAGGYSERETGADLVFGGDGHDHWHVAGVEAHQLETLDGEVVGSLVKTGFCFFDNVEHALELPGAPDEATHHARACGGQFDRDIAMGLSIGWGDAYQWYLLDQTIEITAVPDGRYRLRAIADPGDRFEELDEANNDTWTVVDITTHEGRRQVEVVEQGPSA